MKKNKKFLIGVVAPVILLFVIAAIFVLLKADKPEEKFNPFNEPDKFLVMTGEIEKKLFETVLEYEQQVNILMAFNEDGTDIKEEYRDALHLPTTPIGLDLVYYGQPICIYNSLILPDREPEFSEQWIIPVFIDYKTQWYPQPMIGYYNAYITTDGEYFSSYGSVLDTFTMYDTLFFDFENLSLVFSGNNPNLYISVQEGTLLCNEKGWFPLWEERRSVVELDEYTSEEVTEFVVENSYEQMIEMIEESVGELHSVDIRERYLFFNDAEKGFSNIADIDAESTTEFLVSIPDENNVKYIKVTCGTAPDEVEIGTITASWKIEQLLELLARIKIISEDVGNEAIDDSNSSDIGYFINIILEDNSNILLRIKDDEHFCWNGKSYLIKDLAYEGVVLENFETDWTSSDKVSVGALEQLINQLESDMD